MPSCGPCGIAADGSFDGAGPRACPAPAPLRVGLSGRVLAACALLAIGLGCSEARLHVTIIGVDGAAWRVIDPLLARGELPNLGRLIETGVRAPLRSERPLISPPIWTTVATGVSRREHGILRFAVRGGELVSARQRRAPALWTLASRRGLTSAVIGWWGTYPAETIRGVIVSERALKTREEDLRLRFGTLLPPQLAHLTHPPEVLELLAETLFRMPARAASDSDADWLARRVRVEDEAALRTLVQLRERMGPFDLELLLLRGIDPVSHLFWRYHEPAAPAYAALPPVDPGEQARYAGVVENQYRLVDALLGELPARGAPDRVVLLLSDHGFEAHPETSKRGEPLTGHHRSDAALLGIFVAAGGPLRVGLRRASPVSIYDIAPTALYLMGMDVADTLEGEVLTDLLAPEWVQAHPVRRGPADPGPPVDLPDADARGGSDSALDARLREELRALGYIE
ncbi:MAG: alkaline phosphatase family protein [Myxococcales bacterium]|nr:alkaline phosphatase family protein [Myxococcales bacterium]